MTAAVVTGTVSTGATGTSLDGGATVVGALGSIVVVGVVSVGTGTVVVVVVSHGSVGMDVDGTLPGNPGSPG